MLHYFKISVKVCYYSPVTVSLPDFGEGITSKVIGQYRISKLYCSITIRTENVCSCGKVYSYLNIILDKDVIV